MFYLYNRVRGIYRVAEGLKKLSVTANIGLEMLLREAGMEAIPGGGAEIFDEELRARICPEKGSSQVWLSLHRAAHRLGIRSNATMLYGHVETVAQRIDHLDRLRTLQDEKNAVTKDDAPPEDSLERLLEKKRQKMHKSNG